MLLSEAEKLKPGDKVLFHSGSTIAEGVKGGFVFPRIRVMIVVEMIQPPLKIKIRDFAPGNDLASKFGQWETLNYLAPYDEEVLARMATWQKLYEMMLSEIWSWMQGRQLRGKVDLSAHMAESTKEKLRDKAASEAKAGSEVFRDPFQTRARDKPIVVAKKEK